MAEPIEGQEPQKTPEQVIAELTAKLDETKKIADVSSQNFERAKKAEDDVKALKAQLVEREKVNGIDPDALRNEIDTKVNLRLAGHSQEEIGYIEKFAKGAGLSVADAANDPFVKKAVDGLRAEKKSTENTPAPSNKIKVFNGKPVEKIFAEGSPAEKQAAWEAQVRGGVRSSE